MKKSALPFITLALLVGITAFLSAQIIWPTAAGSAEPQGIQVPLLIFYSAIDALAFGFGISFLIFGFPLVTKVAEKKSEAIFIYLSIFWLLASWWPHDNLHRYFGHDGINGLIALEYVFHASIIFMAAVFAKKFWNKLNQNRRTSH